VLNCACVIAKGLPILRFGSGGGQDC